MVKKVRDVMTAVVEWLEPHETVEEAARKMKALDIGAMPVCEGERVVGALTDRDITLRVTAEGRDPSRTEVGEVMTADVICADEDQDVLDVADLMKEHRVRRIPIVDRHRRLVGMVSLGKLAKTLDETFVGGILRGLNGPSRP